VPESEIDRGSQTLIISLRIAPGAFLRDLFLTTSRLTEFFNKFLGDLWQLGKHRILCGNSLKDAAYTHLLNGRKADVVFVDPPYNVAIDGHVSGNGSIQHREFQMASGEMSEEEFVRFLTTSLGLLARHSKIGSVHYVCMDWRHTGELLVAGRFESLFKIDHSRLRVANIS
jgi:hypothetical protein